MKDYVLAEDNCRYGNDEDVERLKQEIPELAKVSDRIVESMYLDFSDTYAASWMILDNDMIESFKRWLL